MHPIGQLFSYPYLVTTISHWSGPRSRDRLGYKYQVLLRRDFIFVSMSEEESPTRYMLPEQAEGGMVDYSLNEYSPAKYPIDTKKKKKRKKKDKKDKKDKKPKAGKCVHFHDKVTLLAIYRTLKKNHLQELDLTNEDDYPSRVSAFALKRNNQKQILKYQHQYRPLTPRRLVMLNHVQKTLLRVNGNLSSSSHTPQTPKSSTQTRSSSPSPS